MVYQAVIIDAYLEYKSNCLMGYDQCFQQIAASLLAGAGLQQTQAVESGFCWASQNHMTHSVESGLSLWTTVNFPQETSNSSLNIPHPPINGTRNTAQTDLFPVE